MEELLKFIVFIIILFITLFLNNNVSSNKSGELDLSSLWTIQNANKTFTIVNQTIPSGVYSALEEDQIIESVLHSYNDVNARWIAKDDWTYSLQLPITEMDLNFSHVVLTFHGLDTLSEIYLNNILVGKTNNMFVRYRYDVKKLLEENNKDVTLRVKFTSPISGTLALSQKYDHKILPECPPVMYYGECHMNLIRKMQASFSWDWGLAAPSMGIWKPVKLEYYESAVIRDVIFALIDADDFWNIIVTVHMETGTESKEIDGILNFDIFDVEIGEDYKYMNVKATSNADGELSVEHFIRISKDLVELWWPNGYGKQKLYSLYVKWEDDRVNEIKVPNRESLISDKIVRVGFRTIELVQEPTEGGLSFYFKVNGISMFMKGSNYIPASILPEKSYDEDYVRFLLKSAKDTHMNMLRVWGGGLYESDYFYQVADEFGILIWHDLMFACAMYPADTDFLESVQMEVRQNIRRIQYHPSVAIWATNNENEVALRQNWYGTNINFTSFHEEYLQLYVETVRKEIYSNDNWRTVLVSSPSNGIESEKEDFIAKNPQDPLFGDVHFYNYEFDGWNPVLYRGGRFISEYGFQSFPSLNNWISTLGVDDNLGKLIDHRQHSPLKNVPILLMIEKNLPLPSTGAANYWRDVIYMSQVSQAMIVKTETDVYRSKRIEHGTMGALYWQLNDVWIAPSWSGIEYGGQYKILHHWMGSILAPHSVISYINEFNNLEIYAVRDTLGEDEKWRITMKVFKWSSFTPIGEQFWELSMKENTVTKVHEVKIYDYLRNKQLSKEGHVLQMILSKGKDILAQDYVFPVKIKSTVDVRNPQIKVNVVSTNCNNKTSLSTTSLEVSAKFPAIFTYLQLKPTGLSLQYCQFSNNGFMQFSPIHTIYLECVDVGCKTRLTGEDFTTLTINQFLL